MAYQQSDFAMDFCGEWRDGETPKVTKATMLVHQDTRTRAYSVDRDQMDNFFEWVARTFSGDNDQMWGVDFEGDDINEYFEEIGVSVREARQDG